MQITREDFDCVLERFVPAYESRNQFRISRVNAINMAIENAFLFPENFKEADITILREAGRELQNPGFMMFL